MAEGGRRRVNTVCLDLVTGLFTNQNTNLLLTAILRDTYGIANEDLYGVALNGNSRLFVKFSQGATYENMVAKYQDVLKTVNPGVTVRLRDVSRYYTWVKVRNVPFEADECDLRNLFEWYGTVHMATLGRWRDGPVVGMPEGSFSLKMSLKHPIPSYVIMEDFRTQVYVTYSGQRRTCRICGTYDHIAAQCPTRRGRIEVATRIDEAAAPQSYAVATQRAPSTGKLWSEEVEGEQEESPVCLTLPGVGENEGLVSAISVEVSVPPQDVMEASLQEALAVLLDASAYDGNQGGMEDASTQKEEGSGIGPAAEQQVVTVEVHRDNSSEDDMVIDRSCRKRAAVVTDSDDVLTPGQRSGKKAWKDETRRDTGGSKSAQHEKGEGIGGRGGRSGECRKGIKNVKILKGKPPLKSSGALL